MSRRVAEPQRERVDARIGFVLMDSENQVTYANPEAVQILSYPGNPTGVPSLNSYLAERIRSTILPAPASLQPGIGVEFFSGDRRYTCRTFSLESDSAWPLALIFERQDRRTLDAQMASRFGLSRRERQVLEALVTGMSNKEIASRMTISTNTVKVYLRSIMIKMSVSTRAGILARTFELTAAPNLTAGTRKNTLGEKAAAGLLGPEASPEQTTALAKGVASESATRQVLRAIAAKNTTR